MKKVISVIIVLAAIGCGEEKVRYIHVPAPAPAPAQSGGLFGGVRTFEEILNGTPEERAERERDSERRATERRHQETMEAQKEAQREAQRAQDDIAFELRQLRLEQQINSALHQ